MREAPVVAAAIRIRKKETREAPATEQIKLALMLAHDCRCPAFVCLFTYIDLN